ncbi:MAG: XRE family transcriptional regulator [uncultured bacterium]|nr:MAG: XRE family transcriptional regulator [uncultured bacterium]OFW85319.1 MAG: XRE family transcriptional regulator [Alphaproteobacteria bacterium RBG_16_42_14]HBG35009.1 transcriptional regulator [Holosporales bacterium]HBW24861.1 transcriptional regulator [Holosporales bacterium]HCE96199.1 transcriptional regulator [Holosporales bacterium]
MKEIKTTQALGQFMREARKSQGLTQEQLASVSGTGRRFIFDLESGKESCHLDKTLKVLTMLGFELYIHQKEE